MSELLAAVDRAIVADEFAGAKVKADSRVTEIAIVARKIVDLDDPSDTWETTDEAECERLIAELYSLVAAAGAPAWVVVSILRRLRCVEASSLVAPAKGPSLLLILLVTAAVLGVGLFLLAWFAGKGPCDTELGVWIGCEP